MPDIPNREQLERLLGRELGKLQQAQMTRLLELMGDPPRLDKVPPDFWATMGEELLAVLRPFLSKLYLNQAAEYLAGQSIGVDWALVNTSALNWANRYAYDLVTGITANTQAALQAAVSGYFQNGQTIGQLQEMISPLFGPVRAEMIAVTEVTRAASQGELDIVKQIVKDNPSIQAVAVWQTNNDDKVCPVCGPRNHKEQGNGWDEPPPAHPRCRCWLNHKVSVIHA
jgi:hypothetical protein